MTKNKLFNKDDLIFFLIISWTVTIVLTVSWIRMQKELTRVLDKCNELEEQLQEFKQKELDEILIATIESVQVQFNEKYISDQPEVIEEESKEVTAQKEYDRLLSDLEYREDKDEWFKEYKEFKSSSSIYVDLPKSIYSCLSEDEIYLIQRCVETEVYQASFDAKVNVASVIFNRINDGRFGDTVKKVITNPGQFAYHRTKISESTKLAVEYAFEIGDTTDGCIAFRSDKKPNKWGKWEYSFSDNAVHHFYKEV